MATKKKKTQDTSPLAMGRKQQGSAANKKATKTGNSSSQSSSASKNTKSKNTERTQQAQTQKSYGTTNPSVTTKKSTSSTSSTRSTSTSSTQRQQNTQTNNNLKQDRIQTAAQQRQNSASERRKATETNNNLKQNVARQRRQEVASTAAEMKARRNESQYQKSNGRPADTARQMVEERQLEKDIKEKNKQEWDSVKKRGKDEQREWFNQKMAEAEKRKTGYDKVSWDDASLFQKAKKLEKEVERTALHTTKRMDAEYEAILRRSAGRKSKVEDPFINNLTTKEERNRAASLNKSKLEAAKNKIEEENLAIEQGKAGKPKLAQWALDAESQFINYLPGIALGAAGGAAGMSSRVGLADIYARTLESSRGNVQKKSEALRKQLLESGNYSQDEIDEIFKNVDIWDEANAQAQAIIETGTELLSEGAGPIKVLAGGQGIFDRMLGKLARKGVEKSGLRKAAGNLARGIAGEVGEEEVNGPLGTWAANAIYGNKLQGIQEAAIERSNYANAKTVQDMIQTPEDLQRYVTDLNSPEFFNEMKNMYIDSGCSKLEATELANITREFFAAAAENDYKKMDQCNRLLVNKLAGGDRSMKESWTMQDAINVAASTSIMVAATGGFGAVTTEQAGRSIMESNGVEGVSKMAGLLEKYDAENSTEGKAVKDALSEGKEISGTQAYEITQKAGEVAAENLKREEAGRSVALKKMAQEDLRIAPFTYNEDGSYSIAGPETAKRYEQIRSEAAEQIVTARKSDPEFEMAEDNAEILAEIKAAFDTGAITTNEIDQLVDNAEVRSGFEVLTGIDLDKYNVTNRKGTVNQVKSNIKMQEGLLALAAENYVESARIEQEAWNDTARGEMQAALSPDIGIEGDKAVQKALETVDPRDRSKFMLIGSAARKAYRDGRLTNDSWSDVRKYYKQMFPSIEESVLKDVFESAKKDKEKAANKYYGKQVTVGEAIDPAKMKDAAQVRVLGKVTDNRTNTEKKLSDMSFYTTIASVFGVNIELVDDLPATDKYGNIVLNENGNPIQAEGSQSESANTIKINTNESIKRIARDIAEHEIVHHIRSHAPEQFRILADYVMDEMYKADPERFMQMIKAKQDQYKKGADQDLTVEGALEEMIANGAVKLDWDRFIEDIQTEPSLQAQPKFIDSVINAFRDLLRKLRSVLSSGNVINESAKTATLDEILSKEEGYKLLLNAARTAHDAQADRAIDEMQEEIGKDESYLIAPTLSDDLQAVLDGTFNSKNNEVLIGNTSNFMVNIMGAEPHLVTMSANKAYRAMATIEEAKKAGRYKPSRNKYDNYHGLGKDGLLEALESAEDPVIAFADTPNYESGSRRYGHIVLVTDKTDSSGNYIVVIQRVDSKGQIKGKRVDVNNIVTAYGKEYIKGQIQDAIADNRMLHVDKKRSHVIDGGVSGQFAERHQSDFNKNIDDFWANVNYEKYMGRYSLSDDSMFVYGNTARWTDKRIGYLIREYGATHDDSYSKAYAVMMSPRDFLKLTLPDETLEKWNEAAQGGLLERTANDMYPLHVDWLTEEPQTPFLQIRAAEGMEEDGAHRIQGHEGRHRMRALLEAGIESVPVVIQDTTTKYSKEPIMADLPLASQSFYGEAVNDDARVIVNGLVPIKESNRDELTEKFGGEADVKFSLDEPVERVRDLIAVHNLKPNDIINTFKLGGFPMPSIAVVKDSMGHDMYGDITLMFHSDTIDPKTYRTNEVYGGDAWTPTFPTIKKLYSTKKAKEIANTLKDILGIENEYQDLPKGIRFPDFDQDNLSNKLDYSTPGEAYSHGSGSEAMKLAYLKSAKNFDVAIPMKEGTIKGLNRETLEFLDDKLPALSYDDIFDTVQRTMEYEPAVREARRAYYESKGGKILKALSSRLDEEMGYSDVHSRLEALIKYRTEGIPEVIDDPEFQKILDQNIDEEEYKAWVDDLFEGIVEKEGIRNNTDMYTNNGRRSWSQLHDPVTLDNVVRAMRREISAGGSGIFGANPVGAAQKKYSSLDEVRADEDRLQQMPEKEYEEIKDAATQEFTDVCGRIVEQNQAHFNNRFGAVLDTGEYIAEILNTTRDKNRIQEMLRDEYMITVSDDLMDDLMAAIERIANIPTGYFEAKPRRAVGIDEVRAAIIPSDPSLLDGMYDDIRNGFEEYGVPVYEYDHNKEGDRTEKVNQAATEQDIRFSITDSEGDELSDGQVAFFANSKNRDAEDRLKVMLHGTNAEFTEFDPAKAQNGTLGRAFYFTDSAAHAGQYGNVGRYYLNLEHPLAGETHEITKDQIRRFVAELAGNEDYGIENYGAEATIDSVTDSIWGGTDFVMLRDLNLSCVGDFAEALKVFNRVNGTDYDGIITSIETVAFYPEQIKRTDNLNPTLSKDTRYSITDADGDELSDGQILYFRNSKARDKMGMLVPVYHTTNFGGFTVFDPSFSDDHRSLFFCASLEVSQTYADNANRPIIPGKEQKADENITFVDFVNAYYKDGMYGFLKDNDVSMINVDGNKIALNHVDQVATFIDAWQSLTRDGKDPQMYIDINGEKIESHEDLASWIKREIEDRGGLPQRGYYKVYLNLENPLVIDCMGAMWHSIEEPGYEVIVANKDLEQENVFYVDGDFNTPMSIEDIREEYGDGFADQIETHNFDIGPDDDISLGSDFYTYHGEVYDPQVSGYPDEGNTRHWAEYAMREGYDGVIFLDVRDNGPYGHVTGTTDVYIAFASNQVKDINNLNPTESPDIRWSIVDDEESKSRLAYQDAMDDSYEALVRYEELIDEVDPETYHIKPFREEDVVKFYDALTPENGVVFTDPVLEEDRVRMAKSKGDFYNHLNAKWQDRWTTEGEVLDIKSVKTDIRNLVIGVMNNSDTPAKYRNEIVKKTLMDVRTAYQLMKQDQTGLASALLYHSALRMIDNVEFYVDDTFEMYKDLRDYLRTTKIALSEEYWSDVDYGAFRKRNFGRLKLVKGTTNVDQVYQELQERYPEWFNEEEDMTPPDQLLQIEHVLDAVQPYKEAYSSEAAAELAFDIADELYDIMAGGKEVRSLADTYRQRYDEKTKAMKQRHAEAMLRMRQAREIGIQAERAKWQAREERRKEKQAHSKYFGSIKKTYDKLTERLLTNTKEKHIPEQYKKDLAGLLAAFDFQTARSKDIESKRGYKAQKTIKLEAMRTALERIEKKSQLFHVNDAVTDIMNDLLGLGDTGTQESIEGKALDELSYMELKKIDKLLKALLHEFNTYETVNAGAKRQQAADIGHAQNDISLEHASTIGPGKDYQTAGLQSLDRIINLDMMTPAYLFRMIDPNNEGLGLMWKEIRRSFDRYVRNTDQLNEWMNEIVGPYHDKGILWNKYGSGELTKWRSSNYVRTFSLTNGSLSLTPAQMMSVYCLSHRGQAYDHMTGAGVVAAPVSFQAKIMSDVKQKVNKALPLMLTDADIKTIVSALTPEQIKVADQIQELMATKMADWGNEASVNVLGIRLFEDPDYFPIRSDKAGLTKDLDPNQFEQAIRNFGFTKAVQPGARNAIMIEDIFDVVVEHCNNMNLYNSYTEAMNDFMKVYNYREVREEGEYTVEQALRHAYSDKTPIFIMQFMRDLNGNVSGRPSGIESLYNALLANAKKASVFANARVAAQQPTAISRAFYVIDPKYMKGIKITRGAMTEMFEHCPIALWKSWGYYDINMGKSIEDVIMNNGRWLEEKATDLYGALDNVTWTAIWQMVKAEMKDTHPEIKEGTDEYWEMCNERMTEIVDLTQVVDSPMHRSHAMRDKGFFKKMTTAFMAEPTLTFNMLRDGVTMTKEAYKRGKLKLGSQILAKTIAVYLLQCTMVAGAQSLVDALRGKNPGGDDDDDDSYAHLVWANFLENWKDEFNPLGKIYVIKDMKSIMDGWDNRNLALQGVYYLSLGFRQLVGVPNARSSKSWYENMLYGVGYLSGVPIKTMMTGIANAMRTAGIESPALIAYGEFLDSWASKPDKSEVDESSTAGKLFKLLDGDASLLRKKSPANLSEEQQKEMDENGDGTEGKTDTRTSSMLVDELSEKAAKKAAGLTGEERDEALWDVLSEGYTKKLEAGDMDYIEYLELAFMNNGGNLEYFHEKLKAALPAAYKKTIKDDMTYDDICDQWRMYMKMKSLGITDEEVSEICYKSNKAKDLKAAMRLNNQQFIEEESKALIQAGMSTEDYEKLYKYRNNGAKTYKGKYKDLMKSTGTFIWPTQGEITSKFGPREAPTAGASTNHPSIDIGAAYGSDVVAADGGTVIYVGFNSGYGNSVGIKHDNGMVTYYNHLSSYNVNEGDTVSQGQLIAQVGSTGISTGPHLDFKILDADGNPVDPEKYL